jgi:hypothetical protein
VAAASHYTVKTVDRKQAADGDENKREKLRDELDRHLESTWTIELQRRNPSSQTWETTHEYELNREETGELTAEVRELEKSQRPQRLDELVDDLLAKAEEDASIDGATRVRAVGKAERTGKRPLFEVPWIAGQLLPGERKLQAADANVSALTSTTRALETAHRILERSWQRNQSNADAAGRYIDGVTGNVTRVLETLAKLEAPSIDAARLKLEQQDKRAQHESRMAEEAASHEMFIKALELFGKALDADRRDRKEDREHERRARGETIDTSAREASSSSNGAKQARPTVPRCSEAAELVAIFDDLDATQATKAKALLTSEEWDAIGASCDAPTQADFDARFRKLDDLWSARGQENATEVRTKLGLIVGFGAAMTMQRLFVDYEKRVYARS